MCALSSSLITDMKRRKTGSKGKAQTYHFKNRLLERYDIGDGSEFITYAIAQIKARTSKFIEKQSNRVSVHSVCYKDQEVFVVYDKERTTLVTVLEPEWVA